MAGGEELVKKLEPSSRSASSKRATSEFPCAAPSVPVDSTSAAPPTSGRLHVRSAADRSTAEAVLVPVAVLILCKVDAAQRFIVLAAVAYRRHVSVAGAMIRKPAASYIVAVAG